MHEIIGKSPDQEKNTKNIFNISNKTEILITCIQGLNSSPTITEELYSNGYENFACLSGGIIGLSDFLNDGKTSSTINSNFYDIETSLKTKRQNLKQTECYSFEEYYREMIDKELLVITHSIFSDLKGTIIDDFFKENNIKVEYFKDLKKLKNYLHQSKLVFLAK